MLNHDWEIGYPYLCAIQWQKVKKKQVVTSEWINVPNRSFLPIFVPMRFAAVEREGKVRGIWPTTSTTRVFVNALLDTTTTIVGVNGIWRIPWRSRGSKWILGSCTTSEWAIGLLVVVDCCWQFFKSQKFGKFTSIRFNYGTTSIGEYQLCRTIVLFNLISIHEVLFMLRSCDSILCVCELFDCFNVCCRWIFKSWTDSDMI